MSEEIHEVELRLLAALKRKFPQANAIESLKQLSGGASQETWSFDLAQAERPLLALILRRSPKGIEVKRTTPGASHATEADVIRAAYAAGVPVPEVHHVLSPDDGLGPGYVMSRVPGETIARKILRDEEFKDARSKLAFQCGEILAKIHRVPLSDHPPLHQVTPKGQFDHYRDIYDSYNYPHPVFEAAFAWLQSRLPEAPRLTLVHGDFRNGNLVIGSDGVRSVLDWELTHVGDPAEDLGWLCVNSWRFGNTHKVAGGFGDVSQLLEGYKSGGGIDMTEDRVRFWQIFGTLKWGIMCMTMYQAFHTGSDRSVERAAIGRRSSETEIDLVNLLYASGQ